MGFTQENIASQFYRDSRLGSIGGGCDEVMLQIIARYMQMIWIILLIFLLFNMILLKYFKKFFTFLGKKVV